MQTSIRDHFVESDEEKKQFNYSIKAVQELFDAAKKIDNSLN